MSTHRRPSVDDDQWVERQRPAPPQVRWTTADIARRRSLAVARDETERAELRGDGDVVVQAWHLLVAVLEAAERARADPPGAAGGESPMDELARRSFGGDAELVAAMRSPAAWTSEDGDDDDEDEP